MHERSNLGRRRVSTFLSVALVLNNASNYMDVALKRSLTQFYYNMNLQTLPNLFLWYHMRHPVQLWTF